MRETTIPGGAFTLAGTSLTVNRMGYGAMQLAGQDGDKRVWGPPRDIPGAIAVLREAVASGVNHIDTSDFYGPHVTNQIIKQALHPYPDDLVIVTKVGGRRGRWFLASRTLLPGDYRCRTRQSAQSGARCAPGRESSARRIRRSGRRAL
jgi:aryl-alcohol dehydrogenase-like predicted oxidoreductase